MILRTLFALLLAGSANIALAGEPGDASAIAADIVKSRLSDGFQARMQVVITGQDKRIAPPLKIAVIGERTPDRQRLLVRGISPAKVRNRMFAAEMVSGRIEAVAAADGTAASSIPSASRIFDSGIVLWDLMTPWWQWSDQQVIGNDSVDGHGCTLVRSRNASDKEPVSEVVSCVDEQNLLPWRSELFGPGHKLLRTITVKRAIRAESGTLAAKAMVIALPGESSSDVQVYSGDEHYLIAADTFAIIDGHRQNQAP